MPSVLRAPPKLAASFYTSPEWRSFVDALKVKRGWKCVRCGPIKRGVRLIGDHICELKDGGAPFNEDNVQLLCLPCHNTKTAGVKASRR